MARNILLVVLDSVSASRLSCYGYHRSTTPHIDDIAADATRYENVCANSSWTVPTHGTLFTGLYPSEHGAHANHRQLDAPASQTLAGKLSAAGYHTVGFSANPWITAEFGYDSGFDEFHGLQPELVFEDDVHPRDFLNELDADGARKYLEFLSWAFSGNPLKRVVNTHHIRTNDETYADGRFVNRNVAAWLEANRSEPFFMFINFMDAHEPYEPSPEHRSKFRDTECSADVSWHLRSLNESYSSDTVECVNDKYDACLNYLDERVRDLFDELERHGLRDGTTVVLTADHGKCLGEHGYMGVGTYLYDELVRVPLIVVEPDEKGGVVATETDQIDVHDLLMDRAGVGSERSRPDGLFSETMGPHQDVAVHDAYVPPEGLSRVDHDGRTVIRDASEESVEFGGTYTQDERKRLRELESTHRAGLSPFDGSDDEGAMEPEVRDRLERLGYL